MTDLSRRKALGLIACLPSIFMASNARAHSYKLGDVQIGHCWMLANAPGAKETKGFMPLVLLPDAKENTSLEKIDCAFAKKIEIRRMQDGGKFETLLKLDLQPGKPVAMRADALHLAFLGLTEDLKAGARLPVRLTFSGEKTINVDFIIENTAQHG